MCSHSNLIISFSHSNYHNRTITQVLQYKFNLDLDDKNSDTSRIQDVVASWVCYLADRDSTQVDDPMAESLCQDARLAVANEAGVREFVRSTLGENFEGPAYEQFIHGITSSIGILRNKNGGVRELLRRV